LKLVSGKIGAELLSKKKELAEVIQKIEDTDRRIRETDDSI
jgi:hypothetical protein